MESFRDLLLKAEIMLWILPIFISGYFTFNSMYILFVQFGKISLDYVATFLLLALLASVIPLSIKGLRASIQ
ncbi:MULTISPECIES: hypothetical protein [Shewanella]|uniref:Uncharacterized protein n=2 Tax=Shewanella TaxID=22 RepID=A0A9X1ZHQ2_9GAMM|nr:MULTISPECIES: hypothetical protein [Shewanella]MCL1128861.1 hypothetical protein [Shewanella sairae]MCL1140062.1 hypothetical protein [Shewanella pneumatophori]GIU49970.1 hypothetical protein TUM4438_34730 [Shewanella sairae]